MATPSKKNGRFYCSQYAFFGVLQPFHNLYCKLSCSLCAHLVADFMNLPKKCTLDEFEGSFGNFSKKRHYFCDTLYVPDDFCPRKAAGDNVKGWPILETLQKIFCNKLSVKYIFKSSPLVSAEGSMGKPIEGR